MIPATQPINALGPFADPRPTMRGRYLIRNRLKALVMAALDALLRLPPRHVGAVPQAPTRILVADWGHLGDVITTFGAIAALRNRYPNARIDMIVGSWGHASIAATGLIDAFHVVDHWAVNRAAASPVSKLRQFRQTRARALRAIRAQDYQVAVDFYPFFPPAHPIFRAAGIPVRIGYDSAGFGPLLSHPSAWDNVSKPMAEHYRRLLSMLDPAFSTEPVDLRPRRDRNGLAPLPAPIGGIGRYIVLHPGAGAAYKDWGRDHWHRLMKQLPDITPDHRFVFTGAGTGEAAITTELARAFPGSIDMAGRAKWEEFVSIVAHADLVICPDTATGHVAALFDTPVISIFTGTNDAVQWAPYGKHVRVVTQPVLCAPCNRGGCAQMACIRNTTPDAVIEAAIALLSDAAPIRP